MNLQPTTSRRFEGSGIDFDDCYFAPWSRAADKDRRWFRGHPHRSIRFRKPLKGELEFMRASATKDGLPARIAVWIIKPGLRQRRVIYTEVLDATEATLDAVVDFLEDEASEFSILDSDDAIPPSAKLH